MRIQRTSLMLVVSLVVASSLWHLRAQEGERRLWDPEFLKKRQTPTTSTPAPARPSPVYKRTSPEPAPSAAAPAAGEMVGITIWRLRPSTASDRQDSRLLLQDDDKGPPAEWTPERVEAGTAFRAGEPVRLSIESPRTGFLYVVDREQYGDGTTSDPYLIFPTLRIRRGDNAVAAGKVVELPDGSPFRLKAMRPDYRGELLTLLITSEPLRDLTAGAGPTRLDRVLVEGWERQWLLPVERFEMVGGAGRAYTGVEKQAGVEGRLLTQDDELPQTLLRVTPVPSNPLVVNVSLPIVK